jgi:hypothetical protein
LKKRIGFQAVRIQQKKDGNQEQLRTNVLKKRTGSKPIPREEPPQWLAIEASQGASTVMVLVASSCLVTLPKSTAVTASWNGPSKPNVIVAELPDADIWKFPVPSFCLSFSRMAAKSAEVFV